MNDDNGWVSVQDELPERKGPMLLVTNNIESRNAHGQYSHLWLTRMIHPQDAGRTFDAFSEPGGSKVFGVSHWRYAAPLGDFA